MPRQDVFLNAGEYFFRVPEPDAHPDVCVRTLLGSCVSIVLWSPRHGAGMSHSVLPVRNAAQGALDGNHCGGAVALFRRELERRGTRPEQFAAYIVGGARMSLGLMNAQKTSVGERNVETCRRLLVEAGFRIAGEHVGLTGPRRLTLHLASGRIEVLHDHRAIVLAPGEA